jgi:hypothetical protein
MRLAVLGLVGAISLVAAASANAAPITPRPDADTLLDAKQPSSITPVEYYERHGWGRHGDYGHRWGGYGHRWGGYGHRWGGYYGGGYNRGYRYRNWYGY